jgi:hypothetical protein
MREYLHWLAPQYEEVLDKFNGRAKEVRDNFRKTMKSSQHNRLPGVVAELFLAIELFLRFAVEAGAVTEEEKASYETKCWESLIEASELQETHQRDADPTSFFVRMLQAALAGGRAHVAAAGGQEPRDPERWGWRLKTIGSGVNERDEWQPQGERIGWIEGKNLYLQPDVSYAEAQKVSKDQGDSIPVTQRTLFKRMKERRMLITSEAGRNHLAVRRTLGGSRRYVLHLHAETLCPSETGPTGPTGPKVDESPEKWATSVGQLDGNDQQLAHETGPKPLEKTPIGSIGPVGPLIGEEIPAEGEINSDWGEA